MRKPADIFEEDLSDFVPKPRTVAKPEPAIITAAEAQNFRSREPRKPPKKADRRRRTGRNAQLNIKLTEDARSEFLAVYDTYRAKDERITQGEVLQMAVRALRELDSSSSSE